MPEEGPLQSFISLAVALEAEGVVFVEALDQVEHLGGCLVRGEWWGDGVVYDDWDTAYMQEREPVSIGPANINGINHPDSPTIGVDAQEPILLLLVGHDVDKSGGPLSAVDILQLLEQDLDGLAIGCVHSQQMKAFGVLHLIGRLVSVERSHDCGGDEISVRFSKLLVRNEDVLQLIDRW